MKHIGAFFLIGIFLALPLSAQDNASPDKEKLEGELRGLQQQLVKSAARAQSAEAELGEVADKLRILSDQLRIKNETLAKSRKNLAALVQAALHLSQSPPEVMMMLRGDTDAMKIARALKMTSDGIREDVASIEAQAKELERLRQKMAMRRSELAKTQEKLGKERKTLQASLETRKRLQEQLGLRREEMAEKTADLARKAGNVQTLVTSLRRKDGPPDPGNRSRRRSSSRSFADARGHIRFPVEGKVVARYGMSQGQDGTNKGMTIAARAPAAQVVAPFDGEVVFSGAFLDYGKMVILRHSDDFHTLLAGLAAIDVSAGDFLLEGEPIGAMGGGAAESRLYVELRKDNQPINPDPWIQGLNKKH